MVTYYKLCNRRGAAQLAVILQDIEDNDKEVLNRCIILNLWNVVISLLAMP